ncbi:MAG: hypothetical protein M1140_15510 [Chloroflexi bacterium]|nr:hypothetical protein [Chloroflexota bacterium]
MDETGWLNPESVVGKGYTGWYITRAGRQSIELPDDATAKVVLPEICKDKCIRPMEVGGEILTSRGREFYGAGVYVFQAVRDESAPYPPARVKEHFTISCSTRPPGSQRSKLMAKRKRASSSYHVGKLVPHMSPSQ